MMQGEAQGFRQLGLAVLGALAALTDPGLQQAGAKPTAKAAPIPLTRSRR